MSSVDDCAKCFEVGENIKDLSTVVLIGPPMVLLLSLIIAVISIWYFVSAVGHEMIELERMAILVTRNLPIIIIKLYIVNFL